MCISVDPQHLSLFQCRPVSDQPFLTDFILFVSPEQEITDRQIRRSSWPSMVQMLLNCPASEGVLVLEIKPRGVDNVWPSPVLLKPHLQGVQAMLNTQAEEF